MGDHFGDRGRDRRKKFSSNFKEREERNYGSRRPPVILTKPDGERDRDSNRYYKNKIQENAEKPLSQPTIMQRTRDTDNRPVSPSQRTKKENETPGPSYTLASKHSSSESTNALTLPLEMNAPVKLIDDQFQILDNCLEFLIEQNDFVVVGVVGMQGVGKSTLMSHLAGSCPSDLLNTVFKSQTLENQREWKHCTSGVDFYISSNRVIFLDTQPILSASIMDSLTQDPKKILTQPHNSVELLSIENSMEVQSLQLTAFLMSVCHIVVLVQDWFFNPNVVSFNPGTHLSCILLIMQLDDCMTGKIHCSRVGVGLDKSNFKPLFILLSCSLLAVVLLYDERMHDRFIQTSAMLKPLTHTTAEDGQIIEYFPQLMLVQTHCIPSDFSVNRVKIMQEVYRQSFNKSMLQLNSGVGIANGGVMKALTPTTLDQEPLNLFLLPSLADQDSKSILQQHPGYEELVSAMRQQLLGIGISQLSTTPLSEKNWFHYAVKVWENIKKSSFFHEYGRLLP